MPKANIRTSINPEKSLTIIGYSSQTGHLMKAPKTKSHGVIVRWLITTIIEYAD